MIWKKGGNEKRKCLLRVSSNGRRGCSSALHARLPEKTNYTGEIRLIFLTVWPCRAAS